MVEARGGASAFGSWAAYLSVLREALADDSLESLGDDLDHAAERIAATLVAGGRVAVAGNGGSAADANHLAAELVCLFTRERGAMDVISLSANSSVLTAWGNDQEFDSVFARQVDAHLRAGDALILLSTSGNSTNIVLAAESAQEIGAWTLGFTGVGGGRLATACDLVITVPSALTPQVQEMHLMAYHYLCARVEKVMATESRWVGPSRYSK